ncbi:hypothetical protein RR46_05356 [Papilio xuthus]|uniref:Uncharacterized protein n=1 Tax=Papilio xuthus TaxID=66420 RepID=A0A194QCC9_PAPXU|nr:hypothetical protein RR46_05356 [Papilio xuthus]
MQLPPTAPLLYCTPLCSRIMGAATNNCMTLLLHRNLVETETLSYSTFILFGSENNLSVKLERLPEYLRDTVDWFMG